jgi:nicotinamidase-related amidase
VIEVNGKLVFTELSELVDPRHTALVVVDMQRDFCTPGGAFDRLGISISMYPEMVPKLVRLVEAARAAKALLVFVLMTVLPDRASDSPAQIRFNMRMHSSEAEGEPLRYTEDGSEGQRLIPELTIEDGDLVVKKYRSSAFWGTNLDLLLKSNGIQSVVIAGCTTEGCVESTARDAMFNDYYVVIAQDCVASDDHAQHDASMLLMQNRFDIASSEEILREWSSRISAAAEPTPAFGRK